MSGLQGNGGVLISEKHLFCLSSFHDEMKFIRCGLFDHDRDLNRHFEVDPIMNIKIKSVDLGKSQYISKLDFTNLIRID